MPENLELGRLAFFSVSPHGHRLLLNGVKRKVSRRSLAELTFHELMSVTMDEFRKAQ
jgi:hypothetical protein